MVDIIRSLMTPKRQTSLFRKPHTPVEARQLVSPVSRILLSCEVPKKVGFKNLCLGDQYVPLVLGRPEEHTEPWPAEPRSGGMPESRLQGAAGRFRRRGVSHVFYCFQAHIELLPAFGHHPAVPEISDVGADD